MDKSDARYCSPLTARFLIADPVDSGTPIVPQSFNRYSYARNNPLNLIDPSGLIVVVSTEAALDLIRSTLPGDIRSSVKLNERGQIDAGAISAVNSDDQNFTALRELVDSEAILEVTTGPGFSNSSGFNEFLYQSVPEIRKEMAALIGQEEADKLELVATSFLGGFNPAAESLTGNARVVISNGSGSASTAPGLERTITTAHEVYGHALLNLRGTSYKHDNGGPVDKFIINVEKRTQDLYE